MRARRRFDGRSQPSRTEFLERLRGAGGKAEEPFRIAITLTRDDPAGGYGDYSTAHELGSALAALGFEVSYWERHRDRWRDIDASIDVVIALLDAFPVESAPDDAIVVAWVRNWTERWIEQPGFDDYDLVFASSTRSKEIIEARSSRIAEILPLATNPARFRPQQVDPKLRCDLNFTGNYWERPRSVIEALPELASTYDVKVFGKGWDRVRGMSDLAKGSLAYEDLPRGYSSADLVVDDAATHTKPFNAVNARVFDALACGTLVVSNCADGVRELFDEEFPVWHDSESLRRLVFELRRDPARAHGLAERYRAEVLGHHTYAHRAEQIREVLTAWCAQVAAL